MRKPVAPKLFSPLLAATSFVLAAMSAGTAVAQTTPALNDEPIVACPSQQDLDQVIGSNGQITPDDCTTISINRLNSNGVDLCLVDFGMDEGFLGRLRDAAFPSQWWIRCDRLDAGVD